jgi:hypothetical protein
MQKKRELPNIFAVAKFVRKAKSNSQTQESNSDSDSDLDAGESFVHYIIESIQTSSGGYV